MLANIRRRLILLPIAVALTTRGAVLSGQPLPTRTVPVALYVGFLVAAVVVILAVTYPRRWTDGFYTAVALATGAPYLAYVAWVLSSGSLSGIVLATLTDLTLLPYLVALTFGRTRMPVNEGETDES